MEFARRHQISDPRLDSQGTSTFGDFQTPTTLTAVSAMDPIFAVRGNTRISDKSVGNMPRQ